MLRGLYTAAAGMISQQRRQEMLTDNMANASTPGYKADQASLRTFPSLLIAALSQTVENPNLPVNNELATGVYLQEKTLNFLQGDLMETGNNTDMAILNGNVPEGGMLLFAVETEEGIRYTRNGNFTIDSDGTLVTMQGYPVLDENGNPITLNGEDFQLRTDGTLIENGEELAQINVVLAENANDLVKEGNGLFRFEGEGGEPESVVGNPAVTFQLQQRFLERSNVDPAQTMTDMLNAYRMFEANQAILQSYDQSLEKAVNEIGRI